MKKYKNMTQNPMFEMYKDPLNLVIIPKEVVTLLEIKKISFGSSQVEMYLRNEVAREKEFFIKVLEDKGFKENGKRYIKQLSEKLEQEMDLTFYVYERDLFPVTKRIYEATITDNHKPIEVQIRELRIRNNSNQIDTAKRIGITPAQLSNIERGRCKPSFDTAEKIARLFNSKFIIG